MSTKKLTMAQEANRSELLRRRAKKRAHRDGSMAEEESRVQSEQGSGNEASQMEG